MVEMPMMSTPPGAEPTAPADAAAAADAPQGAFEEMLARRLGRELVGRHAGGEHGRDRDPEPSPWMPPSLRAADVPGPGRPMSAPQPEMATSAPDSGSTPAPTSLQPQQPIPATPGVSVEPIAVKVHVNRPGFRVQLAEAGNIQPGPAGDVWTQPSGFADLHLTRSVPRGNAAVPRQAVPEPVGVEPGATRPQPLRETIPEPPVVHWSPAPARAALAASANRDLEMEIVSQMVTRTDTNPSPRADLELVAGDGAERPALQPVALDVARTADGSDAVSSPRPAVSSAHSSLIDRIMTAVEIQRHLPPPRAISIEIPDMDGLRLLVTMRMDGTVHVASSATTAQQTDQVSPLLQAVDEALTERGFDMSADTGGRRDATPDDEQQAPRSARPFRFRRQARRAGLRI